MKAFRQEAELTPKLCCGVAHGGTVTMWLNVRFLTMRQREIPPRHRWAKRHPAKEAQELPSTARTSPWLGAQRLRSTSRSSIGM